MKTELIELLGKLLDKAETDKRVLISLKNTSVTAQMYELAAELRDIEKKMYPATEEQIEAKKVAEEINTLFRMADLSVQHDTCFLIWQLCNLHRKKKGKETLDEVIRLKFQTSDYFNQ